MPTPHRQQMIEGGYAYPHHGHSKTAAKVSAALAAEDQARLDKNAEAVEAAEEVSQQALAEKQAEQVARHEQEASRRPSRKSG